MEELQRLVETLMAEVAGLKAQVASLETQLVKRDERLAERDSEIAELRLELVRRQKGFRPKANTSTRQKSTKDRRKADQRQHPGTTRPEPPIDENTVVHHEVTATTCPHCLGELIDTGEYVDQRVEDIPQPKVETHRYRRHILKCACCHKQVTAASDEVSPQARIGPNALLLQAYCRSHLGISLGKANDLLAEFMGLSQSRAGALGQLVRVGEAFDPVVQTLLKILHDEPVVHADETGWRINGKNVWCWVFCNPRVALYLIDNHRSGEVVQRVLGDRFEGVLVTDFYSAYNRLESRKQKCLVHLLRELHTLREKLPAMDVAAFIQPVITLLQDAISLGKRRNELTAEAFEVECQKVDNRLDDLVFSRPEHSECERICNRLAKHRCDLFVFLQEPHVPSDNNAAERDIRSVAAARSDGGVNRTPRGAKVFANIKSVIRTCQKQGLSFFDYGRSVLQAVQAAKPPPLPFTVENS